MKEQISMIELFSGVGAQERALRQLKLPYSITNTCDCDANAVLSYAAMRWDLEKEMATFNFPSQEQMIAELQAKNLGYDFQKGKHTITSRTPIKKLKQYYIADKLSKNLGDISKVERLPYAKLVTYSFPCTDVSVAGKGEGMANKCEACGHSWPIDFSSVEKTLICPECGAAVESSTRSGLLGQVQRLLAKAYEDNELPDMLLMENVKNLTGKKFIGQFETWVNWLDSIGYNTYWKVLNAKHFGIPQNRERVFAISIRKDVDTKGFTFPETIPLEIRLKDILEKNVDEKYYLPDERIEKILNTAFMQEKMKAQIKSEPSSEDTVPVRLGGLYDTEDGKHQAGAIWDKDAISPTLDTMQGGNRQPYIVDEIKVIGNYMPSNYDASRVVDIDGIAPTVKENHGTVTAIAEPFIVASRGRNLENPSDRTTGAHTEQRLEPNFSGCSNTLTSVGKDNYVCEPQVLRAERTEYGKAIRKQYEAGEVDEKIGNMREMKPRTDGVANTITTLLKDNYVAEPQVINVGNIYPSNGQNGNVYDVDGISPTINAGTGVKGNGIGSNNAPKVIVKESIVYDDYNSRISADQDAINTLTCNCGASAERNGVKIIEAELKMENIVFPVMVRKYDVDCKLLCECLRDHKDTSNFSNNDIADALNIPLTKVEHWFRRDDSFAIPDPDVWPKLKDLLGVTTDEFDESIMTFEIKDGVYDKSNRCYHVDGIAPTLTAASANEKIIEPVIIEDFYQSREPRVYTETAPTIRSERTGLKTADGEIEEVKIRWRIRKLTAKECWRLMNFGDEDVDRASDFVSDSSLYKQAGNSIVCACLIALMSSLFIEDGHKADVWTKYALHFND